MLAFVCKLIPRSVNAKYCDKYKAELARAFKSFHNTVELLEGELYGIVYYFVKRKTDMDADNISKPIWDSLEGIAYADDKIIKMRYSGIYNLREISMGEIDISNIPDVVFDDFMQSIDNEDHILYIELGRFDRSMFKFNIER